MKLNSKVLLLGILIPLGALLLAFQGTVFSAESSDAIAVKIVPNPNHYSISRWYELKGIGGSPQYTTVDGYPAIRNGRTIYVNAASVDPSSKTISTNIYLISYNQDQTEQTTDILGRIVSHWKFNENLATPGTCSISSIACTGDKDCSSGYSCEQQRCRLDQPKNCLGDSDCPSGLFCDSAKAKIVRDVNRLAMVEDIKYALQEYESEEGDYPTLTAGTYIPNLTLSTWPSWNNSLLKSLSLSSSFVDPINRLASCPGHDPLSCWNASTSRFYFPLTLSNLEIPQDSYLFVYSADRAGDSYKLCSFMESGSLGYDTPSHELSNHSCSVTGVGDYVDSVISTVTPGPGEDDPDPGVAFSNHAPQLVDVSLQGEENQPFSGYIQLSDEDGDTLSWQLETAGTNWAGWSAAPTLKDISGDGYKKLVYASKAGTAGDYPVSLVVSDNRGGIIRANLTIKIKKEVINFAPSVEASDFDYYYSCASTPLNYSFYVLDENQPVSLTISKVSANPDILSGAAPVQSASGNRSDFVISINPSASLSDQDRAFTYRLRACDSLGACSEKQVSIRLHPGANGLEVSCPSEARLMTSYYCRIGSQTSSCFNNMSLSGNPAGISLVQDNGEYAISGKPSALGSYNMALSATDDKGSANSVAIPLKVNTYCGDGILQQPNSEGKGGTANIGYEQCDIAAGVATSVSESAATKQYGCVPDGYKVASSPYPIVSNSYCVFGDKVSGYGGYCGDGYCQARVYSPGTNVQVTMETTSNCRADCGNPEVPEDPTPVCGNGKLDSGEVCDGSLFASNSSCSSVNPATPYGTLKCISCALDTSSCSGTDPNAPVCGDGKVSGNESCDYASFSGANCSGVYAGTSGALGCNTNCTYNSSNCRCADSSVLCSGVCCTSNQICVSGSCQVDPSTQVPSVSCGDGIINQTSEQCDGSALGGKTCATINSAKPYGTLKCSGYCQYDLSGCSGTDPNTPVCGNGRVESWEQCDGTKLGGNTCASLDSSKPYGTLKCSSSCFFDTSGCSGTDPNTPVCGNGVIDGGEQCDGTNFGGKTCASINSATPQGSLKCTACKIDTSGCSAPVPQTPVCGNGKLEGNEQCDGSALGGKTCSSLGYAGGTLGCDASCKFNTISCSFFCPTGNKDGYVYPSMNNGGSQTVTKSVCYRSNGGTWTATASCNNATVSISNASLVCNSGYLKVGGAWYQENYGCYDACVYATCAAGTVDGYSYSQMNHGASAQATKTIPDGSCSGKVTCSDGTATMSEVSCTCAEGVYDSNSQTCVDCFSDSDCSEGYKCNNKVCEKKCWSLWETVNAFTYYEGDILASYGCSATYKDNPGCVDNPRCPSGCNDYGPKDVGDAPGSDSCRDGGWHHRDIYRCGDNDYVTRCFGDACRLTLGYTTTSGKVNAQGKCVYNYYCGDGMCTVSEGEDCGTCSQDCGACVASGYCGDDICNYNEDYDYCTQDCGYSYNNNYSCGDGYCDLSSGNENSGTCPQDCGYLYNCGDGYCETMDSEDSYTCPDDCGSAMYY